MLVHQLSYLSMNVGICMELFFQIVEIRQIQKGLFVTISRWSVYGLYARSAVLYLKFRDFDNAADGS